MLLDGGERIETELPTGAFEYHQLKDYFVTYAFLPWRTCCSFRVVKESQDGRNPLARNGRCSLKIRR